MSVEMKKSQLLISPDVMKKLLSVPLPNFHAMYQKYLSSQFRRDYLKTWAGDDLEKQRIVKDHLDETTPM